MKGKPKSKAALTPYQRIMRAFAADKGVNLSRDEVDKLACDNAIQWRSQLDDLGIASEVDP